MQPKKTIVCVLTCLAGLLFVVSAVQAVAYEWNTDSGGSWYDDAKWNPPTGHPTAYEDTAAIKRSPLAGVVVTLAGGAILNSLDLMEGNTVLVTGGNLIFGKTEEPASVQPTLNNNGSIVITDYGYLRVSGYNFTGYELTITGTGTITVLNGGTVGPGYAARFINDIDPITRTCGNPESQRVWLVFEIRVNRSRASGVVGIYKNLPPLHLTCFIKSGYSDS
jgi:hypothetical protein